MPNDLLLYIGGDAQNLQRRRFNLTGRRCFSAAYGPKSRFNSSEAGSVCGILDSGAFSDSPARRLTPESALERQLRWERDSERWWQYPWRAEAFVSYDLLIDEVWTGNRREKRRWSIQQAEKAVCATIEAAAYLAGQRARLQPRRLLLSCQGVDWQQYRECVVEVLKYAAAGDWIGLGGWCILGRFRSWIPQFWATVRCVLPLVVDAGVRRVHLFGVMYLPVLGGLLWLADQYGLVISTDSSGPALSAAWRNAKKAGAKAATWEENCRWWRDALGNLRSSPHFREPSVLRPARQHFFFSE